MAKLKPAVSSTRRQLTVKNEQHEGAASSIRSTWILHQHISVRLSSGSARNCDIFFLGWAACRTRQVFWVEAWHASWMMEDWQNGGPVLSTVGSSRVNITIMISLSAKDCTEILPRRPYEIWRRSCTKGRYDVPRLGWNGNTFMGDPLRGSLYMEAGRDLSPTFI